MHMIQSLRGYQVENGSLAELKDFSSKLVGNPDENQLFNNIDDDFYDKNMKELKMKVFCLQFFSLVDCYEKQNRDKFKLLEK